jgi:hypothetical protein
VGDAPTRDHLAGERSPSGVTRPAFRNHEREGGPTNSTSRPRAGPRLHPRSGVAHHDAAGVNGATAYSFVAPRDRG